MSKRIANHHEFCSFCIKAIICKEKCDIVIKAHETERQAARFRDIRRVVEKHGEDTVMLVELSK